MTIELEYSDKIAMQALSKAPKVFRVTAKHIEGTQMCKIELPCKYKDKELTIVVYE